MSAPYLDELWERIIEVGGEMNAQNKLSLSLLADEWVLDVETLALTLDNGIAKGFFKVVAIRD